MFEKLFTQYKKKEFWGEKNTQNFQIYQKFTYLISNKNFVTYSFMNKFIYEKILL